MTSDQERAAIAAEVARGREALEEAELLLAAAKLAGAVSRACYAAFPHARALLIALGEEPRTHGELSRLLQRDVVRTGRMAAETASLLSRLMTFRQDADYTAEYVFTATMAAQSLEDARAFVGAAGAILVADGWLTQA